MMASLRLLFFLLAVSAVRSSKFEALAMDGVKEDTGCVFDIVSSIDHRHCRRTAAAVIGLL